ncbi:cytochrome C oxidase subunit IV family protein [Paraburkholderia sp. LEh10]|jgi:cytochrome c oxidase subunit 4|uniref:cytochrome C oxidase subunit IV family protein n=1 Tax=Paraburkholderia sp. LEh10 TaxID=2821353 RepID=UPI001AE24E1E|nr:cytochrome C oxidase subunit IV family protein [Paraburkholderia sp. LEh10]MBP0588320.1 cytochrome C oxidase subunit IV family protein [Paraburkholderia sp. LEh10]
MNSNEGHRYKDDVKIWVALVALLLLTFGSSYLKLGAWNSVLNLFIAVAKALLVAIYFMNLRRASPILRIASVTALLMLAVLFGLSGTDYSTRTVRGTSWQAPTGPQDAGAAGS